MRSASAVTVSQISPLPPAVAPAQSLRAHRFDGDPRDPYGSQRPAGHSPEENGIEALRSRLAAAEEEQERLRKELLRCRDAARAESEQVREAQKEAAAAGRRAAAAEQRLRAAEAQCDAAMLAMRRDLEKATDRVRVLTGERQNYDKLRELHDELRREHEALKRDAAAAAVDAEVRRRSVSAASAPPAAAEGDDSAAPAARPAAAGAPEPPPELPAQRSDAAELAAAEAAQQSLRAECERLREAAARAAGDAAKEHQAAQERSQAEVAELRRRLGAAEEELARAKEECSRLKELEVGVLPVQRMRAEALDAAATQLRESLGGERARRHELAGDLDRARRDAEDWRMACETAERHKTAVLAQVAGMRRAVLPPGGGAVPLPAPRDTPGMSPRRTRHPDDHVGWEREREALEERVLEAEQKLCIAIADAQAASVLPRLPHPGAQAVEQTR